MMYLSKDFRFEASHVLPKHPGKCSRLHGHSWKLTVTVEGPVSQETGFVVDFSELGRVVEKHIVGVYDHQHLGQGDLHFYNEEGGKAYPSITGPDFYPTSENLAKAFFKMLKPLIADIAPRTAQLHSIQIGETCTCSCIYMEDGNA